MDKLMKVLTIQNHCACKYCGAWRVVYRKEIVIGLPRGVSMWHPERNRPKRHTEEELNDMLREEFPDYTD